MAENLEALAEMDYPGRVIIIGQSPIQAAKDVSFVSYAITGRSPTSSQARKLVHDGESIKVEPTKDYEPGDGDDPRLLFYNAIRIQHREYGGGEPAPRVIVSNGAQTDVIYDEGLKVPYVAPHDMLEFAFSNEHMVAGVDVATFEPDKPHYTPRISGVVDRDRIALCLIGRNDDGKRRMHMSNTLEQGLDSGAGLMMATYEGTNPPSGEPILPFAGKAINVRVEGDIENVTDSIYDALAPRQGQNDLRVSVATVFFRRNPDGPNAWNYHIRNRHEE